MCGLSQDSGLGKVWDKTSNFIHTKTLGGMFADKAKRAVMGDEFADNGGLQSSFYTDYKSDEQKKKAKLSATAPAFGTPEYAQWYDANQKTLLG